MRFHAFNIGKPHTDAWWAQNVRFGLITAGFAGERGDRGDHLLHQMVEGDWVFGYSNGHGFVGAGRVGPDATYRLLAPEQLPTGWESTHRHIRQVDWLYLVSSLADGVPAAELQRQAPRQTKELLPTEIGSLLLKLLAARSHPTLVQETLPQFGRAFAERLSQSLRDTPQARRERLRDAPRLPERVAILAFEFMRNPDVVAETLHRAQGRCGRCKSAAPFLRRSDGSPYLEVHHKLPLALGGEDTVENAIALCPNCHRALHYGASGA